MQYEFNLLLLCMSSDVSLEDREIVQRTRISHLSELFPLIVGNDVVERGSNIQCTTKGEGNRPMMSRDLGGVYMSHSVSVLS